MEPHHLSSSSLALLIFLLFFHRFHADAQTTNTNTTRFSCPANMTTPCSTFAVYRTQSPGFLDIGSISDLFGVSRLSIANANNLSSEEGALMPDQLLLIPIECGCTGNKSFANVTYQVKSGDIFFQLSIIDFENLTDYHVIEELNPDLYPTKLKVRQQVIIPLYCKCPSSSQQDQGFRYLITYIWQAGDGMSELSKLMNSSAEAIAAENNIPRDFSSAVAKPILIPVSRPPQLPQLRYSVSQERRTRSNRPIIIAYTISGFLVSCILLYMSILAYRKYRKKVLVHTGSSLESIQHSWIKNPYGHEATSSSPHMRGGGDKLLTGVSQFIDKPVIFETHAIMEATMNLDESYKIGDSFFRAKLDMGVFAVKQAKGDVSAELMIMQMVNHANLIKLAGTAIDADGDYAFLVYEFAEKGSLDKWLYQKPSSSPSSSSIFFLSWTQRLNIALDIANGLLYMHEHTQPRIVHGDIRARNILLTADCKAMISNFSMAKPAMVDAATTSSDVFAFGLVLLELLSGRRAMEARVGTEIGMLWKEIRMVLEAEEQREARLRKWMDPVLGGNYPTDAAISLAAMARACTEENSVRRPRMTEIVFSLSVLAQSSSSDAFEKLWLPCSEENIAIANAVAAR